MNWKSYYRDEFSSPEIESFLDQLFETHAADPVLDDLVAKGAVLSFPHTSVFYGGAAQARVVSALYRAGIERIIALGVFHVWGLEATRDLYRQAMDPASDRGQRRHAFETLRGGFLPRDTTCETPYGSIAFFPTETVTPGLLRPDEASLLAREYCLDTFLALVHRYGLRHDVRLPELITVYVGMTRDPADGAFAAAADLAATLEPLLGERTAVVATGDVTHYGTGYSPPDLLRGRPTDPGALEPLLKEEVGTALRRVIEDKDYAGAFPILDRQLNNDQRYLLPVISEFLGRGSRTTILDFRLSDYAAINDVIPPCFVASSLVAHQRGHTGFTVQGSTI